MKSLRRTTNQTTKWKWNAIPTKVAHRSELVHFGAGGVDSLVTIFAVYGLEIVGHPDQGQAAQKGPGSFPTPLGHAHYNLT